MVLFKKGEWKLFWPFYMALFIGISIPGIQVVLIPFFLLKGFTLTQVGIGMGLMSLFTILAEVPTGAVADIFGKRVSIQVHWILHTIVSLLFVFVTSPWQMYVLFAIFGISGTFASGAFEALPYEICKKEKRKELINEFYSKISFVREIAHFISYFATAGVLLLLGSEKIYTFFGIDFKGIDFLWPIGAIGFFAAFLIFFNVKEDVKPRKINLKNDFIETYKLSVEGIKYAKNHPVINKLFFASFFLTISYIFFSETVYQPFLLNIGFNAEKIALIVAFASIVGAIFSLIPKTLEKKFKTEKHFIEFTIILQLALIVGLFFFNKIFAFSVLFFFIFYNVHRSLREPLFQPFKQLFMKDNVRATVGSVDSLLSNVASVIFFPVAGILLDNIGVINTTISASIPLVIGLVILYTIKMKERVAH